MYGELSAIEAAVAAIRRGEMIVVVDSPDRENEGDLVMAAQAVTPQHVNFMARHGRGLICVPMQRERLFELGIPPMVASSSDPRGTAFHVGVDYAHATSTGISASDRAATIRALASLETTRSDFTQPGHVFPLAARPHGVLARAGHTEAAVDLAVLANLPPAAVICEIAADDGEMERMPGLLVFARTHGLEIIAVSQLIEYRRRCERWVARTVSTRLPLQDAAFEIVGYQDLTDGREHVALVLGDVRAQRGVLVRLHSECLTGDVFGSHRCDCGSQLDLATKMIAREGRGALVYLRGHEGRGIGLLNKLQAYKLQDAGQDTVDANVTLGEPVDGRDYGVGIQILNDLGIENVRLMTNNPAKRSALELYGLVVQDRVPLVAEPTTHNVRYLETKRKRMGHMLAPVGNDLLACLDAL